MNGVFLYETTSLRFATFKAGGPSVRPYEAVSRWAELTRKWRETGVEAYPTPLFATDRSAPRKRQAMCGLTRAKLREKLSARALSLRYMAVHQVCARMDLPDPIPY